MPNSAQNEGGEHPPGLRGPHASTCMKCVQARTRRLGVRACRICMCMRLSELILAGSGSYPIELMGFLCLFCIRVVLCLRTLCLFVCLFFSSLQLPAPPSAPPSAFVLLYRISIVVDLFAFCVVRVFRSASTEAQGGRGGAYLW